MMPKKQPLLGQPLGVRERQVLQLTARGRMQKQIADDCGIKRTTVCKYVDGIKAKLGARTLAHAVAIAYERGILPAHDAPPNGLHV